MRKTDVWKIGKKTIVAIIVFAMVFSVFVGMNALNGKAEVFGANVEVSDYGYKPDIALSSTGTIYAAFEKTNVEFSKSIDNGTTFSTPILVTPSETNWQYTPAIAAYGENDVYVVWEQDYKIYYARSTTGGDSFETKVQVSDVGGSGIYNDVPDIAVDSNGVIYVVWAYDTGTDYTISIDKSTDGATFGTDVRVDDDTVTVVSNPSIAIDSANNILVTYEGNDHVYYTKSIDGGAHFSASVRVDDSTSYTADSSMGVGADGKIFVALQYGGDIYVAMSSDGGATFGTDVKVNDDTTDKGQYLPSLAVHPCGKVFVAWKDGRSGAKEIYFANSTDGGATFNTNIKVTDQPPAATYDHGYPSLAVGDDTEVYIAWQDKRSGVEYTAIYFSQAPDATWPSTVDTLAVVGATGDSITINWTAPGDNFALGTATTYDIRYSTSDITTDAEWDAATLVTDEPAPKAGGDDETFIVTGLGNDTTYYFALKTADEIPIWSLTISNVASGKTLDDWAPDAVIDLTAINPTSSGITLTWTAPGDNGTLGTAAEYVIRYSNATINETNWVSATNCTGEPTPQEAGNTETFIVTGLVMNTTYYFALKTVDDATPTPLWSPLSNVATNKTTTNTPPVASNLVITPTAPKTTDNLVRSYVYSDVETDAESGTEIRWYKDDVLQTAYNDALTIPSTATAKDQVWYFTVKPNDGIEFGVLVTSASVTILNSVPVANFTVSPAAPYYRDAVITFNASVSTDPDAVDIVNYTWNVSGEIKYGLEVDYTFTTLGTFNVILTVKDASDVVNSTTLQVTIVNQAPTASFTVSATEVKVGVEIEFTSTSTDPESDTLTYLWTFGD
ncbi:MAG: fibronectin type III domain-containing protein, partial [Candidatus Thermoplasmatota archaeon]|nr:fibronectin type III domain-containing protein [Candidatus Thermoplasmatota archaeon]